MSTVFKNAMSPAVTAETVIYSPADPAMIIGLGLANVSASEATVTVSIDAVAVIKDAVIPVGGSLSPILSKLVMEVTQQLKVTSDIPVDVIASIMEITA